MICATCGSENERGRKFCLECGTRLASGCPSCGAANPAGAKFCGECGTTLGADAAAAGGPAGAGGGSEPPASHRATPAPVAERRIVSILFADLVGFTALAEGRDPEETRELLSRYFELARDVIGRYGGTVEKFIGDAVMAVWGAPTAHEDDAERAVRAGLELVDAVGSLGPAIAARAGVLTGEAAVTLAAVALDRRGHGRRRPRQHGEPAPVGGAAGHGPGRRGDPAGGLEGRSSSRRRASRSSRARRAPVPAWRALRVVAERRRPEPERGPRGAVRRPGRGAAPAQGPLPRHRPRAVAPASSRSSVRPGSARAGSPGSSSSTSTGSSRRSTGTTAAPRPTARASPSGRSARWSASAAGSSPRTTSRRPGRRSARRPSAGSRTKTSVAGSSRPSSRCSASRPRRRRAATSSSSRGARSSSGSPPRRRSSWSSRTSTGPMPACSTSSTTCSSGRAGCPSTSSRSPARSSSSGGPTGAPASATSRA